MKRDFIHLALLMLAAAVLLVSCSAEVPASTPTPQVERATSTPASLSSPVVINRVLAGVPGNNNAEYIELYNRSSEPVDLKGWSLWYRLPNSPEDLPVYRWQNRAVIPPLGYYLLARAGEAAGLPGAPVPDAEFDQPLNVSTGGLQLRSAQQTAADALGWGENAAQIPEFFEGMPAPAMTNGEFLERKLDQAQGSPVDSDNNAADFQAAALAAPRNSGSPSAPERAEALRVTIQAPETAAPGSRFDYTIIIQNDSTARVDDALLTLPLPRGLTITAASGLADEVQPGGVNPLQARLPVLAPGAEHTIRITVEIPYDYTPLHTPGAAVESSRFAHLNGYSGPAATRVEGGAVPVAEARALVNAELTIEGTATMPTGALYAGSRNTKFYLQDETGGIQVQVFEGQGQVRVKIGDRVRVRGKVGVYHDTVQIVPLLVPQDVTVTSSEDSSQAVRLPQPEAAPVEQILDQADALFGQLVQIEGTAARVESFEHSFEIDLTGERGQTLIVSIDRQTRARVDDIEPGQRLRITGILDQTDGQARLYPRMQEDIQPVFSTPARIVMDAPLIVSSGEAFTITLRAENHAGTALEGARIILPVPSGAQVIEVMDGGSAEGQQITWSLGSLSAGTEGSRTVRAVIKAAPEVNYITLANYRIEAAGLEQPASGRTRMVFTGDTVPLWAVQGEGSRSPFTGEMLAVQGIVTGVFPNLGGFFIQSETPDQNPLTSEGLFILTGDLQPEVRPGDIIRARGIVREDGQQTSLQIDQAADIRLQAGGKPLPAPVPLDPPGSVDEANLYFESLEGMLVEIDGPAVAVSPVSRYGEFVVVDEDEGVERLYEGDDDRNGIAVMVDDGSSEEHADRSTLPLLVQTGDRVTGLVGPLAYTFDNYKIEPIDTPQVEQRPNAGLPQIQPAGAGELSIMTWNAENVFDSIPPHPADQPLPSPAAYRRDLEKVARTIVRAGAPDVVGLQEIENIAVLEALAAHEALAPYQYLPVLEEGGDSRGIDVGFLIRADRVEIIEARQYAEGEDVYPRPPLLVHLRVKETGTELVVINNHFTAMTTGIAETEPRRILQAQGNLQIIEEIREEHPDIPAAVLGDLNAFYHSAPIDTLRSGGLIHVLEKLPQEQRYTYIFEGQSQVLDHILVSDALYSRLARVEILHINSDYPPPDPASDSPVRKSDHDPVVAVFSMD